MRRVDVCLDILHVLYDGFKDPKYRPCPLLVKMVQAGKTGRKSGHEDVPTETVVIESARRVNVAK